MNNERQRMAGELATYTEPYQPDIIAPNNLTHEPTLGELLLGMSEDISTLVHKEIELARLEISEKLKKATGGIINIAAGGILLLLGAGALVAAAILGLGSVFAYWLAALIVGVVIALVGLFLVQTGQANVRSLTLMPEKSLASLKEDTEMVKEKLQ